jgi:hypothetical protein
MTAMVATCILVFGCGDSTGPEEGEFEATISGDIERSVSGEAIFGVTDEGGVERWMIFLLEGAFLGLDYDMIGITREASATPIPVGTHTIAEADSDTLDDDDITAAFMIGRHNGSLGVYSSVSGTLTITSASSERVVGTFNFSAEMQIAVGPDVDEVRNLNFTGSFTAVADAIPSGTNT